VVLASSEPIWSELVVPTQTLLRQALEANRHEDAASLVRRLPLEWEEIRFLYPEFLRRTISELRRRVGDSIPVERLHERLEAELGTDYVALQAQGRIDRELVALEDDCRDRTASVDQVTLVFTTWRELHDKWRDLLATAIDLAAELLGEHQLGDLWAAVQKDEIAGYARYDPASRPWRESFAEIVQGAITGMHGHLGGPKFSGDIEFFDHGDHVELRFAPCGSGGRLRQDSRFGVTRERHDWAWNRVGVCYYCAHCCVLQQLTPIERFGIPVRVIDPPTSAGDSCSWRVYRSPDQVPDRAYLDVGRRPPSGRNSTKETGASGTDADA
jgi:hypothetical protein